jgi:membrane protein implicated in regulation of membrane protease activity
VNRWLKTGVWLGAISILAGMGVLIWSALAHTVHPSGDVGYGDIAVGVGTLILAIVTLASVVLGWQALRDTVRATDLSAREVEQAQRP